MSSNGSKPPLSGLKVLELGQILAAPFAGSVLADLGADVVKVERPDGGDGMRNWPPLTPNDEGETYSENFASINRNKRSLTADLKNAEDVERLCRLAERADVVIENFRPGVLPRLGLGADTLRARNPRLVYCSLSGYGQEGPLAKRGAFDVTVQAISGVMSVTGTEGESPVKCGVPFGDICAGLYGAVCILSALRRVEETGEGATIDCSMLGSLLGSAALQTSEFFGTGQVPKRLGSAHPRNAPYRAFEASDVPFVIAAGNDRLWAEVADSVGRPELAEDARFLTQRDRAANQDALLEILAPIFKQKTAEAWLDEMDRRGVPCAPINDYGEILEDPQTAALDLVKDLVMVNGVATKTVAFPAKISDWQFEITNPPPALGAHTDEVLADWLDEPTGGV